ncbi:hypothetical protein IAI10_23790 [Clostridium sp. 19966]|uniref:hypothetical protein n=1 Tax=Clostridium sp. 19966 TaxID=2768166 RepID=UPI0028DDD9BD|nr:hypothetical protein [Clostridium sp. 19966]MDT8719664.1 hypothetical protein [Clostridium sp. 19966]
MRTNAVNKIDYDEFVNMFNRKGKEFTENFVKEKYGKGYARIQKLVVKESKYHYNLSSRKYEEKPPTAVDAAFISIDDLYKGKDIESASVDQSKELYVPPTLDEIMLEMIKDRVLELSQYITIDHCNKKIE